MRLAAPTSRSPSGSIPYASPVGHRSTRLDAGTTVAPVREIECCGFTATAIVKN
jgi:hypothetical protein